MFQLIAFIDPAPVAHVSFTLPIVFPVSALFCRKISEKVNQSMKTVHYQKIGDFDEISKQVKAHGVN